ncbi:MAG TPA: histidine kinase dimerization/phospho-acceptor domain-containing protein, partial [Chloroflexia bacterium]|nr:histidine kinase dimerization/phospho-acceptor domain-containing protein [Chloroflexia bacterium]
MRRPSLLTQFSILSLVLFIIIGVLVGWNVTRYFEEQALQQQQLAVSSLITPLVGPVVDEHREILTQAAKPPPDGLPFEEAMKYPYSQIESQLAYISGSGLVKIKIWNREGMIVYSDDKTIIGDKYPVSDELKEVLGGTPSADISSLEEAENTTEKGYGQLLEVYTPLRLPNDGEIVGAVEGYYDMEDLKETIGLTSAFLWTSIFTGFLFLYVSLFTIVRNASQRLLRQSHENAVLLADTERKAARLELVNELARSINSSTLDLDEVFNTAVRGIDRIVRHSGASISLFDERTGRAAQTIASHEVSAGEIEAGKKLIAEVGTYINGDTRLSTSPELAGMASKGVLSVLLIPIYLGERRLGMLRVVSDVPNSFDEEDAAILKGVADQLAVAIENNRLIRATAETTALRETNRLKDEFVSMVSHELRTPLASVKGYSRTLLAENADWDAQTRREFLQIIADESDKLQELVENLLEMSRIGAGRLPIAPEPLLLKPFVKEVVERVANQYPDTDFKCNIAHGLPVVDADSRRLEQVLANLLQNAAKYSGSHTVWVGAR